jgi:transposase
MSTVEELDLAPVALRHLVVVPDVHEDVPEDDGPRARPAFPVDDLLWRDLAAIAPEVARRRRRTGRRRRDDRAVLEGILHVLATGIAWRELPQELDCGSGVTCWRRLHEWVDAGTWGAIESRLRAALPHGVHVDWARASGGASRPGGQALSLPHAAHDPGATSIAVDRRLAWAGPSLI